ncbi:CAP domain-containing protein [Anaerotruncus colihominis]|uniref:CAP domain-containing protein n=1 Tax=Anaerotruncus colihominis TaxID=169435 RepID=UPI00189C45CE|nr:CAP domain-containing protein [Anaerotruncus colihominis]
MKKMFQAMLIAAMLLACTVTAHAAPSELEEQYGHIRPDGTRMPQTYRCAEIINRRASTPQIAAESWLDSPAYREIILDERYHSAGAACWKGADGVAYWCMLFYK